MKSSVFETERLLVRLAGETDADMICSLWNDPRVMKNVGFPQGLKITRAEMVAELHRRGDSGFKQLLVVEIKASGQSIGQCVMHLPKDDGVASTDVKLLPAFWGNRYGVEIKRGLVAYLFKHTDCMAVEATPNVDNTASIKMQEATGGKRMGEGVSEFPESMKAYTSPVHYYIYRVHRQDWERDQKGV